LPIEEESLGAAETSESLTSEELPGMSDLAEGEITLAFEAETKGTLIHEPVEQS
jgi:hypothetical protein